MSDFLWPALALVLMMEGLLPVLAPGLWRRVFAEMIRLQDGQLRFFSLCCVLSGFSLWWMVT